MKRLPICIPTFLFTATLAFPVLIWPAFAQDRPCLADAQRLCKDLTPGNRDHMMQCLKEHEADLSDACKARMQTLAQEPCAQDAKKLCKDVEPGNRRAMMGCLRDHDSEL